MVEPDKMPVTGEWMSAIEWAQWWWWWDYWVLFFSLSQLHADKRDSHCRILHFRWLCENIFKFYSKVSRGANAWFIWINAAAAAIVFFIFDGWKCGVFLFISHHTNAVRFFWIFHFQSGFFSKIFLFLCRNNTKNRWSNLFEAPI